VPLELYKVIHIVGIILLMSALGGAAVRAMIGGAAEATPTRRLLAILHGVGAFLVLLGGFGMLARLGIMAAEGRFPAWLWVKLVIWGMLAVALVVPRRRPALARPLLLSLPVLGGLAAYMAIYKPF
jgi:uncharacterized membrane protein SirB2